MSKILVFGGTTEGRQIAEYCHNNQIQSMVSVTSEYGKKMLPVSPYVQILCDRMDCEQMKKLILDHDISCVIDATHPYAKDATENIKMACSGIGIACYRVVREMETDEKKKSDMLQMFDSLEEMIRFLVDTTGRIFVTTGSKEMRAFCAIPHFRERIVLRVLDVADIVRQAVEMGYDARNIIAARGPFSVDENKAQFEQSHAEYLVTKDGGVAGGFPEKLEAAKQCGMQVMVLKRPREKGYHVMQICDILMREKERMEHE